MKLWMAKSLMVAGVLALIAGASNAQNLITNGTFEADPAPVSLGYNPATGWLGGGFGTFPGNRGLRNDSMSISGNYYHLNEAAGFQVGVSQVITMPAGSNLTIAGQYASRDFAFGTNSFLVQVLDATTNTILSSSAFNPTALGNWTNFSVTTNTINVSNVRVLFVAQANGFDDDYMIDNITASTTPEPGAVALLALAVVPGIAVLRRRK